MKGRCARCARVISTYVPKGGDGSGRYPRPHVNEDGAQCDGRYEFTTDDIATKKLSACPKCGESKNGFTYTYDERFVVSGLWGDPSSIEAEGMKILREVKNAKCADCGFRVPVKMAEGSEEYKP